jgi:phosphoserine phosphatase
MIVLAMSMAALTACGGGADAPVEPTDPLPSWKEGAAKTALLEFVAEVTSEGASGYVPPEDRIATFDNDGTLWVEKPTYTQVYFILDRVKQLAPQHPYWKTEAPFSYVLAGDMAALGGLGMPDLMKLLAATHAGMEQEIFQAEVRKFFATARHPRWDVPFQDLVYQPQLELLDYLRENGFGVFIVTGGGRDFVRGISEDVYGVPRHQVTGSALLTEFHLVEGRGELHRLPRIVEPIDDKDGKPVNIERDIGRRPILAFGNSDGDIEMLEYAEGRGGPWLSLLLHHDDAEREYSYDKGTEKALSVARERGWVVVSMADDFERVFPASVAPEPVD